MQYRTVFLLVFCSLFLLLGGCRTCPAPTICPVLSCCPMTSCCRSGPVSPNYVGGCKQARCCPVQKKCAPVCMGRGMEKLRNELAAEGVQIIEVGQRVTIIMYTDNCFENGTANIVEGCHPTMDNLIKLINSYGCCGTIKIVGYSDRVGDICNKWDLSRHQANSVMSYLWAHGIPLARLSAKGCACNTPIASPHTVCGNAYNRRVEINMFRDLK